MPGPAVIITLQLFQILNALRLAYLNTILMIGFSTSQGLSRSFTVRGISLCNVSVREFCP